MNQNIEQWMKDAAKELCDAGYCGTYDYVAGVIASHAPSEDTLGFFPWCKDNPNCCGGKCFDSKWCCQGDGKDGHSPECRYSRFGYAEVKPPEIEHNDH